MMVTNITTVNSFLLLGFSRHPGDADPTGFALLADVSVGLGRAKIIHQFFCDVSQFLKLSCSYDDLGLVGVMSFLDAVAFVCFVALTLSCVQIFSSILRMPSAEGLSTVFSTCLPHLLVVTCFLSTGNFAYLKPISDSPTVFHLMLSMFYIVLSATLNLVTYILRNEAIRGAVRKLLPGGEFTRKT